MIRENKYPVLDVICPQNVLVSVFDKAGLETVTDAVLSVNPSARFYSTGGTGEKIKAILGGEKVLQNYMSVEEFTGAPEMEGGLVKTLHPKIHAGLLAERNNPAHETYLRETMAKMGNGPGVYFDIFIGNLYPFVKVTSEEGANAETARVNIDIGGPTMTMAAAKNWHSVAVVTSPNQYFMFASSLTEKQGVNLEQRFALAQEALFLIGEYRRSIGYYFGHLNYESEIKPSIKMQK